MHQPPCLIPHKTNPPSPKLAPNLCNCQRRGQLLRAQTTVCEAKGNPAFQVTLQVVRGMVQVGIAESVTFPQPCGSVLCGRPPEVMVLLFRVPLKPEPKKGATTQMSHHLQKEDEPPVIFLSFSFSALVLFRQDWEVYGNHTSQQLSAFVASAWPGQVSAPILRDRNHNRGFLHRLDVPSSGLILFAKTFEAKEAGEKKPLMTPRGGKPTSFFSLGLVGESDHFWRGRPSRRPLPFCSRKGRWMSRFARGSHRCFCFSPVGPCLAMF